MELEKPRINLREMDFIVCDSCGFDQFKEITYLKRVPKLLTGSSDDTVICFLIGLSHILLVHKMCFYFISGIVW